MEPCALALDFRLWKHERVTLFANVRDPLPDGLAVALAVSLVRQNGKSSPPVCDLTVTRRDYGLQWSTAMTGIGAARLLSPV
jgi:hypothetical protein